MIILTNAQGDVLNTIPDKVYQGSNLANQIVIVSPWSANLQVTIAYKLPNGDFTEPKLMTAFATNPLPENLQANAWSIDIDESVTENFGLVEFQFKAYNGTQIIATGGCSFTVQHGVAPILPATPSQTIYEQILEAISVLSSTIVAGDFESKALTPYDSTFEYSKYDVIVDFQTYGGMYYSLTDNNKGNLPTDTTKWAILPYATLTQLSTSIQAHNTNQTAHTDIRTEIANIINGNTTIEKYQTKDNLVDTWATTPTDSTYPSAKLVKTTIDKIKSDKGLINFVFATKQDFLGWIDGTIETDINGRTTSELQIGSNILIQEENVTDYWCSSISDPLTINDFTPLETELNLSNYLAKDNTTEYTPTGDYNPATKKYADDSGFNNISSLDLSHGEETVTYNTTDGITINGNARKTNTDSSTKDFNVEFNVPIVAGDGINIDATSDNKKVEIKYVPSSVIISGESGTLTQVQVEILSKPNSILGRTIDADHFIVYANQGIIAKNNINYLHYVSIPSIDTQPTKTLNFEAIDINVNDAPNDNLGKWELITEILPNMTTLLSYIDMSPATVEISGTSGTLTEAQMQALTWGELTLTPLIEKSQRNGTILLVKSGDNPILPSKKFYYIGSTREYNSSTFQYVNKAVYASYEKSYNSSIKVLYINITVDAGADYGKWNLTQSTTSSASDIDSLSLYENIGQVAYDENGLSMKTYGSISIGFSDSAGGKTNYFKLPLVPADNSITITADEQNKKFTIKSNIQQAFVKQGVADINNCSTYDELYNALANSSNGTGVGDIGYASSTTLKNLLPAIPFEANYVKVYAKITAGNDNNAWVIELSTIDLYSNGQTIPTYKLQIGKNLVDNTATYRVSKWYNPAGKYNTQKGIVSWSANRSHTQTITFPEAFNSVPTVVCTAIGVDSTHTSNICGLIEVTTTGFTFAVYGVSENDKSIGVHWIAIGE